jgi:hypothetical protein
MRRLILIILGLCVIGTNMLSAQDHATRDLVIITRLFQGETGDTTEGAPVGSRIIDPYSQSYQEYMAEGLEEAARIKNVYNLAAVHRLATAKWHWEEKKPGKLTNTLSLKQKPLSIQMEQLGRDRFQITIVNGPKFTSQYDELLSTEFILSQGHTTIFGFKDGEGIIYFLSFHHLGTTPAMTKKDFKPTRDKIIANIIPSYPTTALEMRKEGTVIIKGEFDDSGSIVTERIEIISGDAEFTQSVVNMFAELRYDPEYTPDPLNKILLVVMFRMSDHDQGTQFTQSEYRQIQDSIAYRKEMIMQEEDKNKGLVWLTFGIVVKPGENN